ncbi:MAG: CYTH domain-containing protein [Patescibacteria group bacterium]
MIELEFKFEIKRNEISTLIASLAKMGFENKGRFYEKTVMYDNLELAMFKTNGRIRLRTIKKTKEIHYEFSYKKPKAVKNGPKKEIEHQIETHQGKDLEKILKAMGYSPTTSYERYRQTLIAGGVKVTIDEFPFAVFVEIEGERKKINMTAKTLGFNTRQSLIDPCDTLFTNWRKKAGLPFQTNMSFADFDK